MKAKLVLLITVVVAAMLPAVAAAHTMSYSYNHYNNYWGGFWTKTVNPSVEVQPGPNYALAEKVGSIHWNEFKKWSYYNKYCPTGSSSGGKIDLQGIYDMTTTMLNVIDINVTNPGYKTMHYVTLKIGVIGDFPHGTGYVISKNPLDINNSTQHWMPFSHTAYNSVTFHFSLNPGQTKTFYIGFYLPPSSDYSVSSGNLWYQVIKG